MKTATFIQPSVRYGSSQISISKNGFSSLFRKLTVRFVLIRHGRLRHSNRHLPAARQKSEQDFTSRVQHLADATKWSVVFLTLALVLYRRDTHTVTFAIGSIVNSAIAKMLKFVLRQPRPDGTARSGHGMPSSHATALSFLSVGCLMTVIRMNAKHGAWDITGAVVLSISAFFASWWRVAAGYHTLLQVVVGWIVGVLNAVIWCWFLSPIIISVPGTQRLFSSHSFLFLAAATLVVALNISGLINKGKSSE